MNFYKSKKLYIYIYIYIYIYCKINCMPNLKIKIKSQCKWIYYGYIFGVLFFKYTNLGKITLRIT